MPTKRKKSVKKSAKTPKERPKGLVAQPNGRGAIWQGAPANPAPGPGRPPSTVRQRALGAFDERIPVLEQIADGTPIDEFEAPLFTILPHVKCPKCATQMEASDPAALMMVSIKGLRSARPGDRTKAVDTLGKYGLGEKSEIEITNHPEVQQFIARHAQATVEIVGEAVFQRIASRIVELEG